jgi:hypothetical protein
LYDFELVHKGAAQTGLSLQDMMRETLNQSSIALFILYNGYSLKNRKCFVRVVT